MVQLYNVGVLDDHELISEAIKSLLLSSEKYRFVGGFTNYSAFIEYLTLHDNIDILLLDIHLVDEDGLQICKELTHKFPKLQKLMLSSLTQQSLVSEALKNGAKGYLPKNVGYQDLIEALDVTLTNRIYLHKDISFLPNQNKETSLCNYLPKLTRREKEILQLILEELTTQEIAEKLFITVSTVETHRSSLLVKTGSKNVVGLFKFTIEKELLY